MNIALLNELPVGSKVAAIAITVKKSFKAEYKEGNSNGREYKFWSQNVVVSDSSGECYASFGWNNESEQINGSGVILNISGVVGEYKGKKNLKSCKIVMPQHTQYTQAPDKTLQDAPQSTKAPDVRQDTITRQWAAGRVVELICAKVLNEGDEEEMLNQLMKWATDGVCPKWWSAKTAGDALLPDEPDEIPFK